MFVAVASSDSDFFSHGFLSIFEWDQNLTTFMSHQVIESELGPCTLSHFEVKDVYGVNFHYLAVGNSWRYAQSDKFALSIYQWDAESELFVHDHSIQCFDCYCLHDTSSDMLYAKWSSNSLYCADFGVPLYPSAISSFELDDITYLAVAYMWDGTLTDVPSYVMKWKYDGKRVLSNGISMYGRGFFPFQRLDTIFALDVESILLGSARALFFASNKAEYWPIAEEAWLDTFVFNPSKGYFVRQSYGLPEWSGTVADIALFNLPDFGLVLAISCAMGNSTSALFVWNETSLVFSLLQTFDNFFNLEQLHTIGGFHFFWSGNEVYLVVSQSVCHPDTNRAAYISMTLPKSAVLQWDRFSSKFAEMQSISDEDSWRYRGMAASRKEKQRRFALRLDSGCASHWDYMEAEDTRILIVSSATRGAVAYKWDFDHVVGLSGPISAVPMRLHEKEYLVVASRISAELVLLSREESGNANGQSSCNIQEFFCFNVVDYISASVTMLSVDLSRILKLEILDSVDAFFVDVLVRNDQPNPIVLCPNSMWVLNSDTSLYGNLNCTVSFDCWLLNLRLSSGNLSIFAHGGDPSLDNRLSLAFTLSMNMSGLARFEIIPVFFDSSAESLAIPYSPAISFSVSVSPPEHYYQTTSALENVELPPNTLAIFNIKQSTVVLDIFAQQYNQAQFVMNLTFRIRVLRFWFELNGVYSFSGERKRNLLDPFSISQNGELQFGLNSASEGLFQVSVALIFIVENGGRNHQEAQFFNFSILILPFLPTSDTFLGHIDLPIRGVNAEGTISADHVFIMGSTYPSFLNNLSLTVIEVSYSRGCNLFDTLPSVFVNGTVSMKLKFPIIFCSSNLIMVINFTLCRFPEEVCALFNEENRYFINVSTQSGISDEVRVCPSFESVLQVSSVENSGQQMLPGAVYNMKNLNSEVQGAWNFTVNYSSSTSNLFSEAPWLNSVGNLYYTTSVNQFGTATLTICTPWNCQSCRHITIKVIPIPRVMSVIPNFGPLSGGNKITITGRHFGSGYSRGYVSSNYSNIFVFVCGSMCIDVLYISDTQLSCIVTNGIGTGSIYVNISDGFFSRGGFLTQAYTYTSMVVAGANRSSGTFLSFGPHQFTPDPSEISPPILQGLGFSISNSVKSLGYFLGLIIVGGDISRAGNKNVNNIFAWDGFRVDSLRNGLDGTVNAIISHGSDLIVGGSFSYALEDHSVRHVGCLCRWNGTDWYQAGPNSLNGIVTALTFSDNQVFAAGRFNWVGSSKLKYLAMLNGSRWVDLDGGVDGGDVLCLAFIPGQLIVGGNFKYAGGLSSHGFAYWDGQWHSSAVVNGDILSLAIDGSTIYVGGSFTEADGSQANHIAVYRNGHLEPLGSGVNDTVTALAFSDGCLLVGSNSRDQSSEPDHYASLTRFCEATLSAPSPFSMKLPNSLDSIQAIILI